MRSVSRKLCKKIKKFILCSFLFDNLVVYEEMKKNVQQSETSHRSKYNMAHALCAMDKEFYKYTLRI